MRPPICFRVRQESVTVTPLQGTFDGSTRALILRVLQGARWIIGDPAARRVRTEAHNFDRQNEEARDLATSGRVEMAGLNQKGEPDRPWQSAPD